MKNFTLILLLLATFNSMAQMKSRLVEMGHSTSDGSKLILFDSTKFYYSNGRSGEMGKGINYDSGYTWQFNTTTSSYQNFNFLIQTFNSSNLLTGRTIQEFTNNSWVNSTILTNTYDSKNNLLTVTNQVWDKPTSSWRNTNRTTNTYSVGDLIQTKITEKYSSAWFFDQYHSYTYAGTNPMTDTFLLWQNGAFEPYQLTIYSYSSNNVASVTLKTFSATTYTDTLKHIYSYDASDNLIADTFLIWNKTGNVWENYRRVDYTYSGTNDRLTGEDFSWDGTSSTWVRQKKYTLSYDGSHNITEEVYQNWNSSTASYVNTQRFSHTYNSNDQKTRTMFQFWKTSTWGDEDESRYYYENYFPTGISSNNFVHVVDIFPNPTSDFFSLRLNTTGEFLMQITSMDGRLLRQESFRQSTEGDKKVFIVSDLVPGMYNISISNKNNNWSGKLTIQ